MNSLNSETIAVALSGGADSLGALIALRESFQDSGGRVFGLHAVFSERPGAAAMRERLAGECAKLGVELHVVDLRDDFLRLVVRPFVQSYADGLTPNPCALCNRRVKFGLLMDAALALGADRLASGHYARLDAPRPFGSLPALYQARDDSRDQSYFLALVSPQRLTRAVFPLEDALKKDLRTLLAARGLKVPQAGESREICFVPGDEYRDFLPRMAATLGISLPGPGPMLLPDGRRVGTHKGLWQYTEGQRRGLGIGWTEPLHVIGKEQAGNVLRLGSKNCTGASSIVCSDLNLLLTEECMPRSVLVKTRYREKPKAAKVEIAGSGHTASMHLHFADRQSRPAPGQVAALYLPPPENAKDERLRLIAGAIIREAE